MDGRNLWPAIEKSRRIAKKKVGGPSHCYPVPKESNGPRQEVFKGEKKKKTNHIENQLDRVESRPPAHIQNTKDERWKTRPHL